MNNKKEILALIKEKEMKLDAMNRTTGDEYFYSIYTINTLWYEIKMLKHSLKNK